MTGFVRYNNIGLQFFLEDVGVNTTSIRNRENVLILGCSLDKVIHAWDYWQVSGTLIQDAFSFLNDDQREFILSGITPAQWEKLFSVEEGDGDLEEDV